MEAVVKVAGHHRLPRHWRNIHAVEKARIMTDVTVAQDEMINGGTIRIRDDLVEVDGTGIDILPMPLVTARHSHSVM